MDEYTSIVHLACMEQGRKDVSGVPTEITAWKGILGFTVQGKETAPRPRPGEIALRFTVRRTGAVAFFGLAVYVAMVVLAFCGITSERWSSPAIARSR